MKHVFVYNPGTYGFGNAGVWEFTFHLINSSEKQGKIVNYNGANSQNCILIIEDPGFHPLDNPSSPTIFGWTENRATPKPATQRIIIYLGAINFWGADANRVIAHEVGHDLRVCHNSDQNDLMREFYFPGGYPLSINAVDQADRDLVDTTERD